MWEADHIWLIFVLGAAFAFRTSISGLAAQRFFGACFALSSLATPFFLGTVVGGVASSRVPPGIAAGDVVTSWLNPTSLLGGVLAVLVCAYLAAVFLCLDARREGHDDLADQIRTRALGTAATTGAVGLVGVLVLRTDAPLLSDGPVGRALPVMVVSGLAGVVSIALLLVRSYGPARITSSVAVATIMIGWAVGQYPYLLLPYLTIADAASSRATLVATTVVLVAVSLVLVPALVYMFVLFSRPERPPHADGWASSSLRENASSHGVP